MRSPSASSPFSTNCSTRKGCGKEALWIPTSTNPTPPKKRTNFSIPFPKHAPMRGRTCPFPAPRANSRGSAASFPFSWRSYCSPRASSSAGSSAIMRSTRTCAPFCGRSTSPNATTIPKISRARRYLKARARTQRAQSFSPRSTRPSIPIRSTIRPKTTPTICARARGRTTTTAFPSSGATIRARSRSFPTILPPIARGCGRGCASFPISCGRMPPSRGRISPSRCMSSSHPISPPCRAGSLSCSWGMRRRTTGTGITTSRPKNISGRTASTATARPA